MKWIIQLLWNPVDALDLRGKDGGVDHGKVIGFFTFLSLMSVLFLFVIGAGELLPLGHTIALISTAYGWAGWRAFLASKAATATEKLEYDRRDVEERYPYGAPTYHFHEGESGPDGLHRQYIFQDESQHEPADLPPRSPDTSG